MPEKLSAPFPAKLPAPFPNEPPAPFAAELPAPFLAALSAPFTSDLSSSTPNAYETPNKLLISITIAVRPFTGSALRDNMLPPPEVEYASGEKLEDDVQTFARGQGYGRE
ncbi:hypothetical protein PsorP6_017479 [Peronosclerospora sorghi]|uniref:Uncharacterized protein n=1 Tax=Peronosclerospora sorghi TaxID=230839 RepID=A0ACC0WMC5_9STRA|nr:hypothetical protein PsorP6_017479 [Peronosclerospora sorghi]